MHKTSAVPHLGPISECQLWWQPLLSLPPPLLPASSFSCRHKAHSCPRAFALSQNPSPLLVRVTQVFTLKSNTLGKGLSS